MDTKQINLFVYDTKENFETSKRFLGQEGSAFKTITCIENAADLDKFFDTSLLGDEEFVFMVVHVFAFQKIKGMKEYRASGIKEKYPLLGEMFISEGAESQIRHKMVDGNIPYDRIFKYHEVYSNLREDKYRAHTKRDILESSQMTQPRNHRPNGEYPHIKYAVITALFNDEFEELQRVFDFPEEKEIKTATKIFRRGHLKTDKTVEIVAATPNSTGMLDSSIVATLMLEFFRPDYLLMSGVCGGSKELSYGDIVVAKQVFTFQKGKVSDIKGKDESGRLVPMELFDEHNKLIDYNHLFDQDGNQVSVSIEKFEQEQDTIIELDSLLSDSLNPKLKTIKESINQTIKSSMFLSKKEIRIVIEPMACSTMIINKEGYFEDTIRAVHRKTAAVEMESYGVARACQLANNGNTVPLIFKSVMDNTFNKTDVAGDIDVKKFAAFTSAQFMRLLFEEKVI